ncbi:MAG TPA: o-succinylbenzoate synthase [Acidimicrobiales bacterium]
MKIEGLELLRLRMPLVTPFRSSSASEAVRDALLVRVVTPSAEGWGECVALSHPTYTSEYVDGAASIMATYLAPRLLVHNDVTGEGVGPLLADVQGHPMAKAALEMAVLDAELRADGESLAARLGGVRDRVEVGVAVGFEPSIEALLEVIAGHVDDGYRRVKLKIAPGWDVEPVAAVRERFGHDLALQVDANSSYAGADRSALAALDALDDFDLVLVEQPLAVDDLVGHAALGADLRTPICLDESITSTGAAETAIELGACSVVNIKAGRVGGVLEAVRVHDVCRQRGVPVWCGGMLETGIGRAANLALASLEGFTLPGDISASRRYFDVDVTPPFEQVGGWMDLPAGPGIGVEPLEGVLEEVCVHRQWLSASG